MGLAESRTALQVTAGIYKSAMAGAPVGLPLAGDDPFYHELPQSSRSTRRQPIDSISALGDSRFHRRY